MSLEPSLSNWSHPAVYRPRSAPQTGGKARITAMVAADWPAVRAIYEEGIATGHATFETTASSNNTTCWLTSAICRRKSARRTSAVVTS